MPLDINKLNDELKRSLIGPREAAVGGIEALLEQEKKLGNNPQALKKYWETVIPQVGNEIKAFDNAIKVSDKKVKDTEAYIKKAPPVGWQRALADAKKIVDDARKTHQKSDQDLKNVYKKFQALPK